MANWLEEHLETFVKPQLGMIPNVPKGHVWASGNQLNRSIIDSYRMFWARGKKLSQGKPILFPGRDAWLLHVIASMEGYPTHMHQELSRSVATSGLVDKAQFAGYFIIDCGSFGTIPQALGITDFALTSYSDYATHPERRLLSTSPKTHYNPGYGFMMSHAKYWTHAEPKNGKIEQTFSSTIEFARCAELTQHFVEVARLVRPRKLILL